MLDEHSRGIILEKIDEVSSITYASTITKEELDALKDRDPFTIGQYIAVKILSSIIGEGVETKSAEDIEKDDYSNTGRHIN